MRGLKRNQSEEWRSEMHASISAAVHNDGVYGKLIKRVIRSRKFKYGGHNSLEQVIL